MEKIKAPVQIEEIIRLRIGDVVNVSGEVYTARDRAHKRVIEYLEKGMQLPFEFNHGIVYHCGPLIRKSNGWSVLSAGPTTSARMNESTPEILKNVESIVIIGKGGMNKAVVDSLRGKGVYLAVTGGAGALIAESIKNVKTVHWEDLGMAEAVWVLEVENLPCTVGIDARGNSIYEKIRRSSEEKFRDHKP
jgi:fumarate hydratase subunit beta